MAAVTVTAAVAAAVAGTEAAGTAAAAAAEAAVAMAAAAAADTYSLAIPGCPLLGTQISPTTPPPERWCGGTSHARMLTHGRTHVHTRARARTHAHRTGGLQIACTVRLGEHLAHALC